MRLLRSVLLFLCLCHPALAIPTGEWWADFYGGIGTIAITETTFSFQLSEDEGSGFKGPLVSAREAQADQPGRLIVGPVKDGKSPYEVVWYYPPVGPRALFFCELEGYPTLKEAEAAKADFTPSDASQFLIREFFEEVNALPVLAVPSKDELVALMQEALRRQKADPKIDTNTLMETLMIDHGHHPTKSNEPFDAAVQLYIDDPEVSRLLAELNK